MWQIRETWAALLRRINRVRVFDSDGSYVDYSTDEYFDMCAKSEYEEISIEDCPF